MRASLTRARLRLRSALGPRPCTQLCAVWCVARRLVGLDSAKELYDVWCVEQMEEQRKAKAEKALKERLNATTRSEGDAPLTSAAGASGGVENHSFAVTLNGEAVPSAAAAQAQAQAQSGDKDKDQDQKSASAEEAARSAGVSAGPGTGGRAIHPYDWPTPVSAVCYSNLGQACYHLKKYELALRAFYTTLQVRFSVRRAAVRRCALLCCADVL